MNRYLGGLKPALKRNFRKSFPKLLDMCCSGSNNANHKRSWSSNPSRVEPMNRLNIYIVAEFEALRLGLMDLIEKEGSMSLVGEASSLP